MKGANASTIIASHGTGLDTYRLEGGAWLDHVPVLLNRDFDFALTMALDDGVGAGLAAAKRRDENLAFAETLRGVALSPQALLRLDQARACGTHLYFLLWGKEQPSLQLIVDRLPLLSADHHRVYPGPSYDHAAWATKSTLADAIADLLEAFAASVR